MTEIGLIGTLGGTLGLFVGFTFMDSGSLILSMIKKGASFTAAKAKKPLNLGRQ